QQAYSFFLEKGSSVWKTSGRNTSCALPKILPRRLLASLVLGIHGQCLGYELPNRLKLPFQSQTNSAIVHWQSLCCNDGLRSAFARFPNLGSPVSSQDRESL